MFRQGGKAQPNISFVFDPDVSEKEEAHARDKPKSS